jgi:hypothetical protein
MDERQMQEVISQIPPEVLLMIIQLVMNATPEELQQLITQLEQATKQGQGQPQGRGEGRGLRDGSFAEQGQQNLYG